MEAASFWLPQTPMLYDILAIQTLYGADPDTRTGNDTYGFNATADVPAVFDFQQNERPIVTIYDAGGIDTLDLSLTPTAGSGPVLPSNQVITLTPGAFSSVSAMKNTLAIAFDTLIENAIGSGGNDTITGNHVANMLIGNGGDDVIDGSAGNDTLRGGANDDTVIG